jgi:hypothetical protein
VRSDYPIAAEKTDAHPPIIELPAVEAETAWTAVAKLAKYGKLPAAGGTFLAADRGRVGRRTVRRR